MSASNGIRAKRDVMLGKYGALMDEIALRADSIFRAAGSMALQPGQFTLEFCYLQIRMICELIALACLLAHGDDVAKLAKKLRKHWSAEKIVTDLVQINPLFFPKAVTLESEGNGKPLMCHDVDPAPLTRAAFLKLYGRCGDQLHRGSLDKLLAAPSPTQVSLSDPFAETQRLMALVRLHRISSADERRQVVCELIAGGARVYYAEAGGSP